MRRWTRLAARALPLLIVAPVALPLTSASPAAAAAAGAAYQALPAAERVLDTRAGAPLPDGGTVTLQLAGQRGLPAGGLTAVVLNITAVAAGAAGFVQVVPAGETGASTSTLNIERSGQTVAALTVAPVSASGTVTLRTQRPTHLVVDVLGSFRTADRPRAGRIVPIAGVRALDTRATGARLAAGELRAVSVRGQVPGLASAAVVNLTAVAAAGAGHVQAMADPGAADLTSNLNLDRAGQTHANLAIVPLRSDRSFSVRSSTPTDLLVDVVGYVTSGSASASDEGTFVAVAPTRVIDSRAGAALTPGATVTATAAAAGIPTGSAAAVLATVTAVSAGAGFLSTGPAPGPVTGSSTLNTSGPASTVANAALVSLSTAGLAVTSSAAGHVLVDVAGYLVGKPRAAQAPVPPAVAPSGVDAWAFWGHLWSDGRFSGGQWTWNQQPYPYAASAQRFVRGAAANGISVQRSGSSYRTSGRVPAQLPVPTDPGAIAAFLAAVVEDEGNACTGLIEDDPSRSRMEHLSGLLTRLGVAHRLEGASGNWRVVADRSSWPIVASWPYATTARTPGVGSVCP